MSWIPSPGDADAIHDNVAGEIAALTEKETPVDADLILIEDSQDGNAKKKVRVGNLPGGASGGSNIHWGTGTIPDSESSVEVSPAVVGTIKSAVVTPAEVEPLAVSALDPTSFTVERSGSSGDLDFYWLAYIDPTPTDVWTDAVFLWDPNHGGRSRNLVGGPTNSDSNLTEGSEVTQDDRPGREYSGAVGSRFPVSSFSIRPPADTTLMAVISSDSGTGCGLWLGEGTDADQYAELRDDRVSWRSNGAGNSGSSSWPVVPYTLPSGLAIVVARFTSTGATTGDLEAWVNGVAATPATYSTNNALSVNRITVGRLDDSSPINSSGIRVFAAAVWPKALDAGEIATVLDDPFAYLSA